MLDLLDVRAGVEGYRPLRLRIEGVVPDETSAEQLEKPMRRREGRRVGRQGLEPCPPD